MAKIKPSASANEGDLIKQFLSPKLRLDPYAFVMYAFPWGKKGTPLENFKGPRAWQKKHLQQIGAHMRNNVLRENKGEIPEMYRHAVSSGRGIGKSTLVAWIIIWAMSTCLGCSVIVSATTEAQLKDRTWAELGKWHVLSINEHWFERLKLSFRPHQWFIDLLKETAAIDSAFYYAVPQLWNADQADSFVGAHNMNGLILIFDEASGIPECIWGVSHGFFTEPVRFRMWLAFSNPRRPDGAFFDCFHKNTNMWNTTMIDSRTVEGLDRKVFDEIVAKGEDTFDARVEVRGMFPISGERQLIGLELVERSMARIPNVNDAECMPLILGIDVARHGEDKTVLQYRRGDMAEMPIEYSIPNNVSLAERIGFSIQERNPAIVFIDAGGGYGVIDILTHRGIYVVPVDFGGTPMRATFRDKKTEMYECVRDWITRSGCLAPHERLKTDLVAIRYDFHNTTNKKFIESKKVMRKWYPYSPDFGDALALTFAQPVGFKEDLEPQIYSDTEYDPFETHIKKEF